MKRKIIAATSPVAMGKALVLFATATSCVALSGGGVSTRAGGGGSQAVSPRAVASRRIVHPRGWFISPDGDFHSSVVALHYRDGDEDQSPAMREANRSAVDESIVAAAPSGRRRSGKSTPTGQGQHGSVDGSGHDNTAHKSSPPSSVAKVAHLDPFTLMPSIPSRPPAAVSAARAAEQEQQMLDEHLEYLERRYRRTHTTTQKRNSDDQGGQRPRVFLDLHLPRKIFMSTVSFHRVLASPSTASTMMSEQRSAANANEAAPILEDNDDPLNALGLTNLASARLRQRLQVHPDLRDEHALITSYLGMVGRQTHHAFQSATILGSAALKPPATATKEVAKGDAGGRTSSYVSLSFPAQAKLLASTLQRLCVAFVQTTRILASFASRMIKSILEQGGFRKSARMAGLASVAFVFLFRPIFRGAMKQG